MTVKAMFRDEIEKELAEVSRLEVGSDKYRTAVDGVSKLADKMIELEKIEIDNQDKIENRENDYSLRLKQIEEDRKDRIVKNVLTGVTFAGSAALAIWGTIISMKFEKEDSFTSLAGRKWVDRTVTFFKK